MIRMIAAVSDNGVIGKNNSIPWNYPEDFKFFKKMTLDSTVIMGKNTFNSIGKPLPKRRNIVITSQDINIDGVEIFKSFEDAIDAASTTIAAVCIIDKNGKQILQTDNDNIWIIGGASLYKKGLDIAKEMYLTIIPETVEADGSDNLIYFPWINPTQFKIDSFISLENSELKVAKYIKHNV